LRYK
jgi:hypothetical protein